MKEEYTPDFEEGYQRWAQEMEDTHRFKDKYPSEEETRKIEIANRIKNESDKRDFIDCYGMSEYEKGIFYFGGEPRGA